MLPQRNLSAVLLILAAFAESSPRSSEAEEMESLLRYSSSAIDSSVFGTGLSRESESQLKISETGRNLKRLRAEMMKKNISAYIILSSDDHQSEYLADHDKRREFISQFYGSSGDVIVTMTKATLWTDSRYYLQAERELDSNWILMRVGELETPSMENWLISELEQGKTVSTDPRIASFKEWNNFNTSLSKAGIQLVYEESNLLDKIWDGSQGRPSYKNEPLICLGLEYAGVSWQDKVQMMRSKMETYEADAFVVTALDEIAWLFNLRGIDISYMPFFRAYVIFRPDKDLKGNWSMPTLYLPESSRRASQDVLNHLLSYDDQKINIKDYNDFWKDLRNVGRVAHKVLLPSQFSYTKGASYAVYSMIPSSKVEFTPSPISEYKSVKNPVEAKGLKAAHVRDAVAMMEFFYAIESGVKMGEHWDEMKAVSMANEFRSRQNKWHGPSFETISAFGKNSALPHYVPTPVTNVTIDTKNVLMFDSGGQYLDGTTDVTRTLYFGDSNLVTKEMKDIYTRLLMGCADLASAIFPEGTKIETLDLLLRQNLFEAGLNYGHGSTHGIGSYLSIHEAFNYTYVPNFFGSQEPGYYIQDKFGMRLENIVTVIEKNLSNAHVRYLGFETVTLVPYEQTLIDVNMMSIKQLRWLNAYHKQVEDTVGQELINQGKHEVYSYLLRKTKPYEEVC